MLNTALLAPAAILVAWSIVMLFWVAATRFPAMRTLPASKSLLVGGRGQDLDPKLPPQVAWKSHNYTHLMEQPTLFYAVIGILTLAGAVTPLAVGLAWTYVIVRILHSLWQAMVNKVPIRFALFMVATLALTGLSVLALIATFSLGSA